MTLYIYEIGPIDFWHAMVPIEQFADEHLRGELFNLAMRAAFEAKGRTNWEGDIREGPYVFALPLEGDCEPGLALAWKQQNNGTTFVASPLPLPWLETA